MAYNIIAILLSVAALIASAYLAVQQRAEQRRANVLPYYTKLLEDFRTAEFHERYQYLCTRLRAEHQPRLGISGLSEYARQAVYDVAYLFQGIGMLWLLNIISRPVMITIDMRVVQVWDAIAPTWNANVRSTPRLAPI